MYSALYVGLKSDLSHSGHHIKVISWQVTFQEECVGTVSTEFTDNTIISSLTIGVVDVYDKAILCVVLYTNGGSCIFIHELQPKALKRKYHLFAKSDHISMLAIKTSFPEEIRKQADL